MTDFVEVKTQGLADYAELKRLAEDAIQHSEKIGEHDWYHENEVRSLLLSSTEDAQFVSAARPEVVLALIAENDRLKADHDLLISNALPREFIKLRADYDQLKAENERLKIDNGSLRGSTKRMGEDVSKMKKQLRKLMREIDQLKTENDGLECLLEIKKIDAKTYKEASERFQAENEALRKALNPLLEHWSDLEPGESIYVDAARAALSKGEQP